MNKIRELELKLKMLLGGAQKERVRYANSNCKYKAFARAYCSNPLNYEAVMLHIRKTVKGYKG